MHGIISRILESANDEMDNVCSLEQTHNCENNTELQIYSRNEPGSTNIVNTYSAEKSCSLVAKYKLARIIVNVQF